MWLQCTLAVLATSFALQDPSRHSSVDRQYEEPIKAIATWLDAHAIETEHGVTWPVVPDDGEESATSLYSGSPGVVLFFLEHHAATHRERSFQLAMRGTDHLIATVLESEQSESDYGLYTGIAGLGLVCEAVARASGEERFEAASQHCQRRVLEAARPVGDGVEWGPVTDVISGSAGIGLYLLSLAEHRNDPELIEVARKAADRLIELAHEEAGGLRWAMTPTFERKMPNFSHGTAGVSYFLATLHQKTNEPKYLDAALRGAQALLELADKEDGECRIFHSDPGREQLFYYGWCHGPPGTARTFFQLAKATGDPEWLEWTQRSAHSLQAAGLPEARPEGFWNNVGQCCGNAGVAELFLGMHWHGIGNQPLEFAQRMTKDLLIRGFRKDDQLFFIQAEHRVKPELLQAQTGYMQGAAGIGLLLLRLDATATKRPLQIHLPDNPFRQKL